MVVDRSRDSRPRSDPTRFPPEQPMADDTSTDPLLARALFVGGGLAGYFGSRWLLPREAHAAAPPLPPTAASSAPTAAAPPAPTVGVSSTPIADPTPIAPAAPPALPEPVDVGPVTSPDQVDAGPVTSPDQVPTAASAPPPGSLPRTFDPLFEKYRRDVPIEFLRALAMRESGMKPNAKGKGGAAWGLLQITEDVRGDFNQRHGTSYGRERLLDPAINIEIACWLLRFIADGYQRRNGDLRNMRTDWNNPRYVELLVQGWNAGFSASAGVMRVVGKLKELGARDVDIDLVAQNARSLGGVRFLYDPARVRWAKSVVALYLRERSLSEQARNGFLTSNPVSRAAGTVAHGAAGVADGVADALLTVGIGAAVFGGVLLVANALRD
ncbi:MAG: transglycosylase SLT domain-containing protein [Kofleriaceae bacterium]|nr:transglycosylase SLT domain-containing protein [Kofleriaceae bacterium]